MFKKYFTIENFDPYSIFELHFEYLIEKGNGPVVAVEQDSDPLNEKGQKTPRIEAVLTKNEYDYGWKKYTRRFGVFPTTKELGVSFKIFPWGDCESSVKRSYRKYCEGKEFNKRFLKDSTVRVRNVTVERVFFNSIVLRSEQITPKLSTSPEVIFSQISPARYKVKIENAQFPFFLVLSTAFDQNWKAYFLDSKPQSLLAKITDAQEGITVPESSHFLANGYSNAWYIEKLGTSEVFLEFYPERIYVLGKKISAGFFVIFLSILLFKLVYDRYRIHFS